MDIYCSKCGEPWESDCLHDIPTEHPSAFKLFKVLGCGAFNEAYNDLPNSKCDREPIVSDDELEKINIIQDMSIHVDDLASDSEDMLGGHVW